MAVIVVKIVIVAGQVDAVADVINVDDPDTVAVTVVNTVTTAGQVDAEVAAVEVAEVALEDMPDAAADVAADVATDAAADAVLDDAEGLY